MRSVREDADKYKRALSPCMHESRKREMCLFEHCIGTATLSIQRMQAFEVAIHLARGVFDMGASLGLRNMHILDIGGGFTAQVRQNLLAFQLTSYAVTSCAEEEESFQFLHCTGPPWRFARLWSRDLIAASLS